MFIENKCVGWHERFKEAQKVRIKKLQVKTMLTVFYDAKGIINHEFVPEKKDCKW
jgi:hypothetical protein